MDIFEPVLMNEAVSTCGCVFGWSICVVVSVLCTHGEMPVHTTYVIKVRVPVLVPATTFQVRHLKIYLINGRIM